MMNELAKLREAILPKKVKIITRATQNFNLKKDWCNKLLEYEEKYSLNDRIFEKWKV